MMIYEYFLLMDTLGKIIFKKLVLCPTPPKSWRTHNVESQQIV